MKMLKTLVVSLLLVSSAAVAQERSAHEVYSMMVYNFTKYGLLSPIWAANFSRKQYLQV